MSAQPYSQPNRPIVGVLVIAAIFSAVFTSGKVLAVPPSAPPTLQLTTFLAKYGPGAPVRLTLQLILPSNAGGAWAVATEASGTVQIASLTRDGVPVVPEDGSTDFVDDLKSAIQSSLRTLMPGGAVVLPIALTSDPDTSGLVLTTFDLNRQVVAKPTATVEAKPNPKATVEVKPNPKATVTAPANPRVGVSPVLALSPTPAALSYVLLRPGTFKLRLRYHYSGTEGDPSNAFTGIVDSNEITFQLP